MTAGGGPRQATFSAWPGFELPSFDGVGDGLRVGPPSEEHLDAVYYDAKDLRLVRAGVTVRHRSGRTGAVWTVTFAPPGAAGPARREVDVVLPAGPPPGEVLALVRAHLRAAELVPVAHLRTRRRRLELLQADHVLAEVDDDEVSVLDGEHVAARYREVTVEIAPDAPATLLDDLVARVRAAGAGAPDAMPRLVRALGPAALEPPDLVPVEVDESASTADLLRASFTASVRRLVEHDPAVRLDDDPEAVHQARVGARRLRADLRTFQPVLDRDRVEAVVDELRWLGQVLGAVRDADVLAARLDRASRRLPTEADQQAARALVHRLEVERGRAQEQVVQALGSPRYAALLDQVVDLAHAPPVVAGTVPASDVLPELVGRQLRAVAEAVDRLPATPDDDALHRVRKKAKRARYAAEAAAPVCGRPAARLGRKLARVQDVLGARQDAVVAESWLRRAALDATPDQALAAGMLVVHQRREVAAVDRRWRATWKAATTPKATRWLR